MRISLTREFLALAVVAALAPHVLGQASIQGLGGTAIRASGISPDGAAIVGYGGSEAHVWTTSNPIFVSTNGGQGTEQDISNGATFVSGDMPDPANGNWITASRWSAESAQWSILPALGSSSGTSVSTAYDISADGHEVVGLAWVTPGQALAFEWTPSGGTVDLGLQFPGWGYSSRANAVSADGATVAGWSNSSHRATRWSGGQGAYLGSLDRSNPATGPGEAYGVSGDGTCVCGSSYSRAFLWSAAGGMLDLGALGTPGLGNAGYGLAVAVGPTYKL
jgi:probable HAF family extracellular repeat protein